MIERSGAGSLVVAAAQLAASRDAMAVAWVASIRNPLTPVHSQCSREIANSRAAVEALRAVLELPHRDPQVDQDIVYLLDNLTIRLLAHGDEDPGYIAEALDVSAEAVARQVAIHAGKVASQRDAGELAEAAETLGAVRGTHADARRFAGISDVG